MTNISNKSTLSSEDQIKHTSQDKPTSDLIELTSNPTILFLKIKSWKFCKQKFILKMLELALH